MRFHDQIRRALLVSGDIRFPVGASCSCAAGMIEDIHIGLMQTLVRVFSIRRELYRNASCLLCGSRHHPVVATRSNYSLSRCRGA
jgi:hypothetical protein